MSSFDLFCHRLRAYVECNDGETVLDLIDERYDVMNEDIRGDDIDSGMVYLTWIEAAAWLFLNRGKIFGLGSYLAAIRNRYGNCEALSEEFLETCAADPELSPLIAALPDPTCKEEVSR
jgi:hypothetical protein